MNSRTTATTTEQNNNDRKVYSEAYDNYIKETEIAKSELLKINLFPDNIIADLYCVPSFSKQPCYVIMSESNGKYYFTYVKPTVSLPAQSGQKYVNISFKTCAEANAHPPFTGDFYIGIKPAPEELTKQLIGIFKDMPDRYIYDVATGIILDGYTQGIRYYDTGNNKIILFKNPSNINTFTDEQKIFLNTLCLAIDKVIESPYNN